MNYRQARKLHNGDEVIRKTDNVSLRVVKTSVHDVRKDLRWKGNYGVSIDAIDPSDMIVTIWHTEVK